VIIWTQHPYTVLFGGLALPDKVTFPKLSILGFFVTLHVL